MITKVVAGLTAAGITVGGVLAAVGYHEVREGRYRQLTTDVAGNSKWILIQEWRRLSEIAKTRRLTLQEWLRWCEAGVRLGIFKVCPSRR